MAGDLYLTYVVPGGASGFLHPKFIEPQAGPTTTAEGAVITPHPSSIKQAWVVGVNQSGGVPVASALIMRDGASDGPLKILLACAAGETSPIFYCDLDEEQFTKGPYVQCIGGTAIIKAKRGPNRA